MAPKSSTKASTTSTDTTKVKASSRKESNSADSTSCEKKKCCRYILPAVSSIALVLSIVALCRTSSGRVVKAIHENPKAIIESVEAHYADQQKQREMGVTEKLKTLLPEIKNTKNAPVVNAGGNFDVVEFFDYSCGFCKKAHAEIKKLLASHKNVRFIFREMPILGQASDVAARAALAVNKIDSDKYLEFHNGLMEAQIKGIDSIKEVAKKVGIDFAKIEKEMNSKEITAQIQNNHNLARDLNINGTPAFVFGEELIPGYIDYEQMSQKVKK